MKRLKTLLASSILVLALAPAAVAMPMHFTAMLNGGNQNPANASPGMGTADIWFDTAADTMRVTVTFSGLMAGTTAAHIHCCVAAPGNIGVASQLPYFPGFPLGVTSGTYDMTFDMTMASSYNPSFITANGGTTAGAETALLMGLMHDMAYLNIHTSAFPGGEVRGFLAPAPEPASLAILGAGLLGAFGVRRRMKKA